MAVLIPDRSTIVTAAPGTASTSLTTAALRLPGASIVNVDPALADPKHTTAAELVAVGALPANHGHTIVTGVRNPFAHRFAEWRRSRLRWVLELDDPDSWVVRQPEVARQVRLATELDFTAWVARVHDTTDEPHHLNPAHLGEADVVVRTEHLDDDVRHLVGPWFPPIPRCNVTGPTDNEYRRHYDEPARDLVGERFRPTLQQFGYTF